MSEEKVEIRQTKYIGQKTAIREINLSDPEDIQRLAVIDNDKNVNHWMIGQPYPDKASLVTEFKKRQPLIFAVSGSDLVDNIEKGELQGWIWFYSGEDVNQRVRIGGIKPKEAGLPFLEVSIVKYPQAPSGQMASGLRQACLEIQRKEIKENPKNDKPSRLIVAFIDPQNHTTITCVEACGFERQEKTVLYDSQSLQPDLFYVLNWEKLNTIIHERADKEILKTKPG